MGNVTFRRYGEVNKAPFDGDPVFANNTWEKIIDVCRKDIVPESWAVGDKKTMTIGGADFEITIIGKYHDVYADGNGRAPLTLQMQNGFGTKFKLNSTATSAGGWDACEARTAAGGARDTVKNSMPTEVASGIAKVRKRTSAGSNSQTIVDSSDDLFLLSEVEVFGTTNGTAFGEGEQYNYYAAGNSKIKYVGTSKSNWWLRSPRLAANGYFYYVSTAGALTSNSPTNALGVSFAFCF